MSHQQLLLRSTRDDKHARRIDILFKMVGRIDLPTLMDDVEVTVAAPEEIPLAAREPSADGADGGRLVYRVAGRGFTGWVHAGVVAVVEDDGEYHAPSAFDIVL